MISIEQIEGGYRINETEYRWTYWVYPEDHEIRNNGERYKLTGSIVAPRLTLKGNWTMGTVIDQIFIAYKKRQMEDVEYDDYDYYDYEGE